VLLGGGVTTLLAACGDDESRAQECARARAEMRPNAEQICQRSTSRSSSYFSSRSWFSGRTASTADSISKGGSSSRSGFGGSSSSGGG
jgi:hypothetical protein